MIEATIEGRERDGTHLRWRAIWRNAGEDGWLFRGWEFREFQVGAYSGAEMQDFHVQALAESSGAVQGFRSLQRWPVDEADAVALLSAAVAEWVTKPERKFV